VHHGNDPRTQAIGVVLRAAKSVKELPARPEIVQQARRACRDAHRDRLRLPKRRPPVQSPTRGPTINFRTSRFERRIDDLGHSDALALQGDVAVLDPGNVDQVIDEPRHVPQLSLQSGERPVAVVCFAPAIFSIA